MTRRVKAPRAYDATHRRELARVTRVRILDAARRLLIEGTYSQVTMQEIARQAGVAYQTLYSVFRTKFSLAEAVIAADAPHIAAGLRLLDEARGSSDPLVWFTVLASMSRRIYEPCADLFRFMRESGDRTLLARYREIERGRHERLRPLRDVLEQSRRLRPQLTPDEAIDAVWTVTDADHYVQLVFERGWRPDRYESWLKDALASLIVTRSTVSTSAGSSKMTRKTRAASSGRVITTD